jgi:hypothetical protein
MCKMRRAIILALIALLIASSGLSARAEPFYRQVAKVMEDLCARVQVSSDGKVRVYVQPPRHLLMGTSEEPGLLTGGGFIRHFRAACSAALQSPFREVARDDLKEIWSEVKLAKVSAISDPDKMLKWAEDVKGQVTMPLDGIIMSECSIVSETQNWANGQAPVLVNIYFVDVRDVSKYTAVGEVHLTSEQVSNASEKPQNHAGIPEQTQQLNNMVSDRMKEEALPQGSTFGLAVNVDRGAGGVYEDGEKMTIYVSPEINCYVAVINVNTSGECILLFPNDHERDNFVSGGQSRQIPGPEPRGYDLVVGPPFGIETIKVIASAKPFPVNSLVENSKSVFPALTKGLSDTDESIDSVSELVDSMFGVNTKSVRPVSREDRPVATERRFAEAICLFTTIPSGSKGLWME